MNIVKTVRTHIPAHPGWYALLPSIEGVKLGTREVVGIVRKPIIGWLLATDIVHNSLEGELEGCNRAIPITSESCLIDDDFLCFEAPHGVLMTDEDGHFNSLFEVLEWMRLAVREHDQKALLRQGMTTA